MKVVVVAVGFFLGGVVRLCESNCEVKDQCESQQFRHGAGFQSQCPLSPMSPKRFDHCYQLDGKVPGTQPTNTRGEK